jgi:phenylacetate-coenzyme A ligase PaaK-like adenylate-forming protein
LADEALRGSLHIRPREVLTGGETLTPAVRQRVTQLLGATVRNNYGASEFLSIAWECAHGHLHVNADWVILEPVDEKHQPVPPGEPSHSCLLTNLSNTVQPLIRYDLSDQITVSPALCVCGSPFSVIEVIGRTDDALIMRGKDGTNVTLLPLALTTVLEELAGLFDFQLRQRDKSTLELDLSSASKAGPAQWERGRQVLQEFARSQELTPIEITGKFAATLIRGRSGKVQRVIASGQKKPSP